MEPLKEVQAALNGDLPTFINLATASGVSRPYLVTLPSQVPNVLGLIVCATDHSRR